MFGRPCAGPAFQPKTKKKTGGHRARRRWPTAQREGGNDPELAKAAIKSTRIPQNNTEQTAPTPPPSPTPAAVTAPKGPWAHHHRNRHRFRFHRRQRWSAAVRRSSATACCCARLLCAQAFPRRLAALESEVRGGELSSSSSSLSAASEPRPPAISTIGRLVCVVARGVGQQGGQGRARDDAEGGADGRADVRAATPNAVDRTIALSDCRLQHNGSRLVFTGQSSRF